MPYETEQLYQSLKPFLSDPQESIMIRPWPQADPSRRDADASARMARVQNLTTALRTVRKEMNIPDAQKVRCQIQSDQPEWKSLLQNPEVVGAVEFLVKIQPGQLQMSASGRPANSAVAVFNGGEAYIPLENLIDKEKEKSRLLKNRQQLASLAERGRVALENQNFIERAPKEEVESRRETLRQTEQKIQRIDRNLEGLS